MLRTYIYLPEELDREINRTAKTQKKSKAEVIRQAVEKGLPEIAPKRSESAKALLEMAKEAKKFTGKAPKDLSVNHDKYTWD